VFDPRWGKNKIENQGETTLGGNNGVIWASLVPLNGFNLFGAYWPPFIKVKLHEGGGVIYFNYAIQTHPAFEKFLCLGAFACHKYLPRAEGRLIPAIDAGWAAPPPLEGLLLPLQRKSR
jgi:hypothetical protein